MKTDSNPWEAIEKKGIKVGGKVYSVKPIDNADSTVDIGNHNGLTQEIRVRDMHIGQKRDTLLHELLHALFWNTGFDDASSDEKMIETLAHGLGALLVDNPHLLELWSQ